MSLLHSPPKSSENYSTNKRQFEDSENENAEPTVKKSKPDSFEQKMELMFSVINNKLDKITATIEKNCIEIEQLSNENKRLNLLVRDLQKTNDQLSVELKKNQLLVFGVPESTNSANDINKVTDLFNKQMGLKGIDIDIVFRIGVLNGKPRPLKVKFVRMRDRDTVWMAKSKLTYPLSIKEDLPYNIRKDQKVLKNAKYEAMTNGKTAKILWKESAIIIDGIKSELKNGSLIPIELGVNNDEESDMEYQGAFLEGAAKKGKKPRIPKTNTRIRRQC